MHKKKYPNIGSDTTPLNEKTEIENIVEKYYQVFDGKVGELQLDIEHTIELFDNSKSIKAIPYRRNPNEHNQISEKISKLINKNFIKPSYSRFSSPVILVPKKDNTIRFCIDYRKLNSVTIKKKYPIPRIEDTIETLQGAKYFSIMDLESGYHQIRIKEEDQHKTVFVTRDGIFEWTLMPFGLINAPFTF